MALIFKFQDQNSKPNHGQSFIKEKNKEEMQYGGNYNILFQASKVFYENTHT